MTQQPVLPPGVEADDEIEVDFARDEQGGLEISAKLGGAQLIVRTDEDSYELIQWLIAGAPQIIIAAFAEIERREQQEADEAAGEDDRG